MKTEWEHIQGINVDKIKIADNRITVYRLLGGTWFDAGVDCKLEEFLEGTHQDVVRDLFGDTVLKEVLTTINKLSSI